MVGEKSNPAHFLSKDIIGAYSHEDLDEHCALNYITRTLTARSNQSVSLGNTICIARTEEEKNWGEMEEERDSFLSCLFVFACSFC